MSFRSVLEKIGSFLGAGLAKTRTLSGHSLWALRVVGFIFAAYFLFGAVNGSFTIFGPRSLKLVLLEFPYIPYYGEQFSLPIFICFTSVLTFHALSLQGEFA